MRGATFMESVKHIAPHVMACKRCEGKGRKFAEVDGEVVAIACPFCQGSGRVKVSSRVVTRVEPFVIGEDDVELLKM
jgi:DnaJ-class molecular chaperone